MKKIMFNDKYGLTQAVLEGRKTQTRRFDYVAIKPGVSAIEIEGSPTMDQIDMEKSIAIARYKVGEEVAVAQSYESMANEGGDVLANMLLDETTFKPEYCGAGRKNKMFTKADLMPHRIKITNVRVERLQDISDEDITKEGVEFVNGRYRINTPKGVEFYTDDARLAFKYLIDKVSGKGTWDSNPWVFVYDFELIK